jgi:hypothetical protein
MSNDPYVTSHTVATAILREAFGLDLGGVTDVQLQLDPRDAAKLQVTHVMRRSNGEQLVQVLRRFKLVEVDACIEPMPLPTGGCCIDVQQLGSRLPMRVCGRGPGCVREAAGAESRPRPCDAEGGHA